MSPSKEPEGAAAAAGHDDYVDTLAPRRRGAGTQSWPDSKAGVIRVEDVVTASFPPVPSAWSVRMVSPAGSVTWSPQSSREKFVIGRSETCNLVVRHDVVSRIHGYITVIDKGCIYIDQSHNGSYVLVRGALSKLRKSGIVLDGTGMIFLGVDPDSGQVDEALVVEFDVSKG